MAMNSSKSGSSRRTSTQSVLLEGSVGRHTANLGYQKFERSVTTILATMLSKEECTKLLLLLREQPHREELDEKTKKETGNVENVQSINDAAAGKKLQVVTIEVLLELLGGMQVENTKEVTEV